MWIRRLRSNVKKGVEVELGPKTLIVGPNGAGKSSIVNSVELLLGSFASDVMGRGIIKRAADLMVLSNDGDRLHIEGEVWGEDLHAIANEAIPCIVKNYTLKFEVKRNKAGRTSFVHKNTSVKACFPLVEVKENLTKSAEKARLWLLKEMGSTITKEEIANRFIIGEREGYEKSSKGFSQTSPTDDLLDLIKRTKEKITSLQSSIKFLNNQIDGASLVVAEPTESQISMVAQNYHRAQEKYRSWMTEQSTVYHRSPAELADEARAVLLRDATELAAIEEQLDRLKAELTELDPHWKQTAPKWSKAFGMLETFKKASQTQLDLKAFNCLLCGDRNDVDWEVQLHKFQSQLNHCKPIIDRYHELRGIEDNTWLHCRDQVVVSHTAWEQAKKTAEESTQISSTLVDTESAALKVQQELAHTRYEEARKLKEEWKGLRQLRDQLHEEEEKLVGVKAFYAEAQRVAQIILNTVKSQFVDSVNAYLPRQDSFFLEIEDKTSRIGLFREGQGLVALSGAEWSRVILAIACVLSSSKADICNVYIPEERAYDAKTLGEMMRSFGAAPIHGQIILTSTVRPRKAKYLEDWTIIDLTEVVAPPLHLTQISSDQGESNSLPF